MGNNAADKLFMRQPSRSSMRLLALALAAAPMAPVAPAFAQEVRPRAERTFDLRNEDASMALDALGHGPWVDPRVTGRGFTEARMHEAVDLLVASGDFALEDADELKAVMSYLTRTPSAQVEGLFNADAFGDFGTQEQVEITSQIRGMGIELPEGTRAYLVPTTLTEANRFDGGVGYMRGGQPGVLAAGAGNFGTFAPGTSFSALGIRLEIPQENGTVRVVTTSMADICANLFTHPVRIEAPQILAETPPCIDVVLNNDAIVAAGGRIIEGNSGVMRIMRRDGADLSAAEVEMLRTCNARTVEISGDPLRPCPDCVTEGQAANLASLIMFTPRTGLQAQEGINTRDYRFHLISRFRVMPQDGGEHQDDLIFSVPTPEPDGDRVYLHPAWCEEIELNGRRYRLELQGEESLRILREAAEPENGSITVNMGSPTFVWQEVSSGGQLSNERYNFRDGRMVRDRDWTGGSRAQ